MNCPEALQALSAVLDGEHTSLSEEARQHIESCPACQEARADYEELNGSLGELYRPPSAALNVYTWPKDEARPQPQPVPLFAWVGGLAAAAALLALSLWTVRHTGAPAEREPGLMTATGTPNGAAKGVVLEFDVDAGHAWMTGSKISGNVSREFQVDEGAAYLRMRPHENPFVVRTPHGEVRGKEGNISITVSSASMRVAVAEGSAEIVGPGGTLTLLASQAGDLLAAERGSAPKPELRPDLSITRETLWRPWMSLNKDEREARLAMLKAMLGDMDADTRMEGAKALVESGRDGLSAAEAWKAGASPELKAGLEAVEQLRARKK